MTLHTHVQLVIQSPKFNKRQFAREVKGVDLRSTAGNCAWVRTPQLACILGRPGIEPGFSE